MAKCTECGGQMVSCNALGGHDPKGGYMVCPQAQMEQTPQEFSRSYRRRVHQNARIMETPEHRALRRQEVGEAQLPIFGEA